MSCPKCETAAPSRRWLWWASVVVLLGAGAWLDRTRGAADDERSLRAPPSAAR